MPWYEVPAYWPRVRDWILEALKGRSLVWSEEGLYDACFQRRLDLWVVNSTDPTAVVITMLEQGVKARVCFVVIVGGHAMEHWIHLTEELEDHARRQGCHAIEAWGRKGWGPVMQQFGWQAVSTAFRKTLE